MTPRGRTHPAVFLLALAIGAAYLAVRYRIMPVVALLVGALGLYAFASGARMIITRTARIPTQGSDTSTNVRMEHHTGASAQIWGVLFLVFGAIIVAIAYSLWRPSEGSDAGRQLLATPLRSGLVMLGVGAVIAMYGATRLIAGKAAFVETLPVPAERYFLGVLFSFMGLVLMTLGVVRIVAPELLAGFGDWLGGLIKRRVASSA